jgi:putative nucleotidyltransferase with HDIG domain
VASTVDEARVKLPSETRSPRAPLGFVAGVALFGLGGSALLAAGGPESLTREAIKYLLCFGTGVALARWPLLKLAKWEWRPRDGNAGPIGISAAGLMLLPAASLALGILPGVGVGAVGALLVGASIATLVSVESLGTFMPRSSQELSLELPFPQRRLAVLRALARTSELRDYHTFGHSQRVAFNAVSVAERLGMTSEELEDLRWAALLHDIGKVVVPDEILLKPGRLDASEFELVKHHSQAGADLIASTGIPANEICEAIAAHHERWDGRGYPVGLSGTEIPLTARVIAVADAFEALTSDRPYRAAADEASALSVLRSGAGTHFDADLVTIFCSLHEQGIITSRFSENESSAPAVLPVRGGTTTHHSTLWLPGGAGLPTSQ